MAPNRKPKGSGKDGKGHGTGGQFASTPVASQPSIDSLHLSNKLAGAPPVELTPNSEEFETPKTHDRLIDDIWVRNSVYDEMRIDRSSETDIEGPEEFEAAINECGYIVDNTFANPLSLGINPPAFQMIRREVQQEWAKGKQLSEDEIDEICDKYIAESLSEYGFVYRDTDKEDLSEEIWEEQEKLMKELAREIAKIMDETVEY